MGSTTFVQNDPNLVGLFLVDSAALENGLKVATADSGDSEQEDTSYY
jgi:hypothetical protein